MPPAADTEEIRRALYAEWDAITGRRQRLRRTGLLAAGLAAITSVTWLTVRVPSPVSAPIVASVERVQGVVGMQPGDELAAGATIFTGSGELALRIASGESLRLGPQTRIELTSLSSAELTAGLVYFDSESAPPAAPFTITAALGVVRDIGTQFFVRTDGEQLEVGVRDGRVSLTSADGEAAAGVGDRLAISAGSADIRRDSIATFGDEWAWVEDLAPPFDIDGRRLSEFFDWFERQTGRTVAFTDAAAERIARETVLSGSVEAEPQAKLAAVMSLTDLDYSLEGERVLISSR
jgi:ferric-dicitrate binding protein FerR (iron transport regulator)